MRYLVTRYEPGDGPQAQMVGFMRSLFGDRMVTNMMLKARRSRRRHHEANTL